MIGFKFEKALRILTEHYPKEDQKKPALFHSVRVGPYLYHNNYSEDIQIAWLLHDIIEDSDIPHHVISNNFWNHILDIVLANSKTIDIPKNQVLEDIIKKCVSCWEDALIVKMADVYDNFLFYVRENISGEIDRCKYLAELIKTNKLKSWNDKIFDLIDIILSY